MPPMAGIAELLAGCDTGAGAMRVGAGPTVASFRLLKLVAKSPSRSLSPALTDSLHAFPAHLYALHSRHFVASWTARDSDVPATNSESARHCWTDTVL